MKQSLYISSVIIFIFLLLFSSVLMGAEIKGKVVGVIDGDTISVLDDLDAVEFRIRIQDIDAPEKGQAFGKKAKQAMSDICFGKRVSVRFKQVEMYGRILGRVYLEDDGTDCGLELTKRGFAWHYTDFSNDETYAKAEKEAREKKVGLWADKRALEPWKFRDLKKEERDPYRDAPESKPTSPSKRTRKTK